IFMHGNNLNSLHLLIHPEILPSELGGMMPPYDMGTWARTLLDHAYDEETDYCPESYTLSVQDLERDLEKTMSPKTMKRSDSFIKHVHCFCLYGLLVNKMDFGFITETFTACGINLA
ncbi:Clavesin-2, partial [Goodea atripinnis]